MHLVVLGAFGRRLARNEEGEPIGLNAPCGAGCFRTWINNRVMFQSGGLNAPCGAECFLT